jgi:threonine efflux protein
LSDLVHFVLGYVAVLATPGPNLLAIGGVAALQGLRGAAPFCLGAALGAGVLCAGLLVTAGATVAGGSWLTVARILGAALLAMVAVSVARRRPPLCEDASPKGGTRASAFGAGFCTAATNPLTAGFFAAQFVGPLAHAKSALALTPAAVFATALMFFFGAAALLGRPSFRATALLWHGPIRLLASGALFLMATSIVAGLL